MGPELSGDYMNSASDYHRFANKMQYTLGFTWTDPDHPQHTRHGCDALSCSPEDRKLAAGKWGIIARTDLTRLQMTLFAVCEDGCPDLKPSCAHIYNQRNCTESHTADGCLHCPIWPAGWQSKMTWRILNSSAGVPLEEPRSATADSYCCTRKPQECDACGGDTCTGLIGLFHNNCPPNNATFLHRQTKLQNDCCEIFKPPPLAIPHCACKEPPRECAHTHMDAVV